MEKKKKEIIIKAAQELFGRFGFLKTTVQEIASAARIGKATIYYYFKGKEEIFKEVIEKESKILDEKIKETIGKEETPQEKLKAFVLARMKYFNELANIYTALRDEFLTHYAFIEKTREKYLNREIEIVKKILKEGIGQGAFVIHDLKLTSYAIISALKGLEYQWSINAPLPEVERNTSKLIEILFNGIVKR